MSFTYVIEEPSPLAPATEWHRFLRFVRHLPQDDDGVALARDMAERHIAEVASRTGMEGEASGAIGA